MYKAIIFDFFGVICTDIYWNWLYRNVKDVQSRKEEFSKLAERIDRGEMDTNTFFQLLSEKTQIPIEKIQSQIRISTNINWKTVEIAKELKNLYKIAILSNSDSKWLHNVIAENKLDTIFDFVIASSDVGFIKPQKEIFQLLLSKLDSLPKETIFIDDRQVHVDAASSIGIYGILFTSPENLKNDLSLLGIPIL